MEPGTAASILTDFAAAHRGVRLGRLFGRAGVYAGRRLFACVMEDGIIVKLPVDVVRREIDRGARPHQRRGRVLRGWVVYRPRTIVDARRLWPILELAARNAADLA